MKKQIRTYIIAEIGNLHEGSMGLAKQMIKASREAGADAVKIQTHIFEAESLPNAPRPSFFKDESRESYFKRTSFSLEQYRELKRYCEELGCEFLSSAFSIEAIKFLAEAGLKTIKVPSGEVSNLPYLEYLGKTKKKVLLPCGMSSWKEIDSAVKTLKENGCQDLTVMQCTSEYPCPPAEAGLNVIMELKKRYGLPVGFSDHTMNYNSIPVAAVVFGAEVVEKHFTLSRLMYGSDAKTSLEPNEFAEFVSSVRQLEIALNNPVNKDLLVKKLGGMKTVFEKSVVAVKDLVKGSVIRQDCLAYKKPGDGIPAARYKELIGKKLKISVKKNHKFKLTDFV
jgi:sialic acid synthase SpsE